MNKKRKNRKKAKHVTSPSYQRYLIPIVLISLTVYLPSLDADFVNWDDETYVEENPLIQDLNLPNIRAMFMPGRFLIGNYHPLTEFSFALNFFFSELNPLAYKATNIFLHCLNTILVFFFFYRFSKGNILIASLISLMFSIHPMHVESVSWISERKDLLYSLFYLAGLISYLSFLSNGKTKYYILSLLLFVFSLLSKAQAVTFPLVLILLHIWYQKNEIKRIAFRVLPFFLLSLVFGLLAIRAQDQALSVIDLSISDRIIVGFYGLFTYLLKSIIPFNLSALHPYPQPLEWPLYYWLFPFAGLLLLAIVIRLYHLNRTIFFGLSFFLLTIFPVLQFLPVGMSMHAERYTYLPYLGIFFLFASAIEYYLRSNISYARKIIFSAFVSVMLVVFGYLSYQRTKVWKNSELLWQDVIAKYPKNFAAYLNLTYHYLMEKNIDQAIKYADQGIRDAGHNVFLYDNKSYAYIISKQYDQALSVLDTAAKYVIPDVQFYINQGDSYVGLNQMALASQSYSNALKIKDDYIPGLLKRAGVYLEMPDYHQLAMADLEVVLAQDPTNIEGLSLMAEAKFQAKNLDAAMQALSLAIKLDPDNRSLAELKAKIMRNE